MSGTFKPMLARAWAGQDIAGWWMSEKLDGVRAIWDGQRLVSRTGRVFHLPEALGAELPDAWLDGELWMGRGRFQATVGRVRRHGSLVADWDGIAFHVFDAPDLDRPLEHRLDSVAARVAGSGFAIPHPHERVVDARHLARALQAVERRGGEGMMLRRPGSAYERRRSCALLKVKTFQDGDATVVGYTEGEGRHAGALGALVVEAEGRRFRLGTGLSDWDRRSPPPIGASVVYRHQGCTDGGLPRSPVYAGMRGDNP